MPTQPASTLGNLIRIIPAEGVCANKVYREPLPLPGSGFFLTRKAIVLSNGHIDDPALMRERLDGWDDALVIGADAGGLHAAALGLKLDLLVGDFDSLDATSHTSLEAQGVEVKLFPAEKDETDLELALLEAVKRGAEHIIVLGTSGGRLDMTLASVLLLAHPALIDTCSELWTDDQTAWLIRSPGSDIRGQRGDTISLIPIAGEALSVTTSNLHYPLNHETLTFGPARGISNLMDADIAHIALHSGLLLIVHTPGRA
jgi:thiamine pyrophosphokinase